MSNELDRVMDGIDNGVVVRNDLLKIRENFTNLDNWDVVTAPADLAEFGGNTAGAGYFKISKCPFSSDTETKFVSKFIIKPPFRVALAMSLSQRLAGQKFTFELASVSNNGDVESNIPLGEALSITSVSQTTTNLTIITALPHDFKPGDRVSIYGCGDSRLNYGDIGIETITSPTSFVTSFEQIGNLPNITIAASTGFVIKKDPLFQQDDSFSITFEGTTSTFARNISRSDAGAFVQSAQSAFSSTDTVRGLTSGYCDSLQPACIWDIRFKAEAIIARSFAVDNMTVIGGHVKRSQNIPNIDKRYKIIIRAINNIEGMSRPVAKIQSATKAGSTTATIVTVEPHELTTNDFITIYGIRDTTNFANLVTSTAVASVINANTFTVAFGASYTGVSYGGAIVKMVGAHVHSVSANAIQTLTRANNLMTLVSVGNWTLMGIGDTINLYGLTGSSGEDYSAYEGIYKVAYVTTTTLVVYSIGPDIATINLGGVGIRRSDYRLHFLRCVDYTRQIVDIDSDNGDILDTQESIPVVLTSNPTVGGTVAISGNPAIVGAAAHDAAISGAPVRVGARALTANYAGVSTGDTSDLITTLIGALISKPFSIPEADFSFACTTPVVNTTDLVIKTAGAAGIRNYITGIQFKNTNAVATEIVVKDGSTVLWRGHCSASMTQNDYIEFPTPLRGTAATAINFAAITTAANIYINAQGYQAP